MKGIYVLIVKIDSDIETKIGSLGIIKFNKGLYAYIGSAQNNLEKRISRHLSKNKKMKWHIDYLLDNCHVEIKKIFFKKASKKEECLTANKFLREELPVLNFGCSDCKCKSHLFKIKNLAVIQKLNFNEYSK